MEENLDFLIKYLLDERGEETDISKLSVDRKKLLYRALVNVRMPKEASKEYLRVEREYLKNEIAKKGIVDVNTLQPKEGNIYLWQGDITCINTDIIVNAGNPAGLGCFLPNHGCVDNAIHTFSGVELRNECNNILKGREIETGDMIVCDAYNLPSKKVITVVGPQVTGRIVTAMDEYKLMSCYTKAIEYACKNGYKSIAFCSISTGIYGFPIEKAKKIAYTAAKNVEEKYDLKIIFNVFSKGDYDEYNKLFKN